VLSRVLIANRGEIARRVIRACRALGVHAIAVYSEPDRDWPHVRDADEAVAIGPAPARESYLDMGRLLEAARASGAEAVHPGYGFLSENWRFARACEEAGLVWIGPPWAVIRDMGDKVGARRLMASAGVPVVPGSEGVVETVDAAREAAAHVGYPVFLKAAAGGGGIGMARVADESALGVAFATAQRRSQAAFGTAALFVERYLMVIPSVSGESGPVFGMPELAPTALFLGLFLAAYALWARTFPMISPRLAEITLEREVHHIEIEVYDHEDTDRDFVHEGDLEK